MFELDSLLFVELLVKLEEKFYITINEEDMVDLNTNNLLDVELLEKYIKKKRMMKSETY